MKKDLLTNILFKVYYIKLGLTKITLNFMQYNFSEDVINSIIRSINKNIANIYLNLNNINKSEVRKLEKTSK